jgi:hypothetical protein
MLTFFEAYDGKTYTKSEVRILGNADNVVKLYLNEQEIALDEFGDFDTTVTLQPGENVAEFVAVDAVGNRTNRTIYLIGPDAQGGLVLADGSTLQLKQFIPLFIALGISLVVIVVSLILARRREKLKRFSMVSVVVALVILTLVAAGILAMTIIRMNDLQQIVGSMELSHLTDQSLQKASDLVAELDSAPGKIILWGCVTGGLAVITIFVMVLMNRRKRKPVVTNNPDEDAGTEPAISTETETDQKTIEENED